MDQVCQGKEDDKKSTPLEKKNQLNTGYKKEELDQNGNLYRDQD